MRGPRLLCLWVLIALAAVSAGAADLQEILERSALELSWRAAIQNLFDQAAAQQVPADLLLPRLEEGLSKRVPPARLTAAIERELRFLVQAREILTLEAAGLLKDEASWSRTANLLAGGLRAEDVRALVRLASVRPRDFRPLTYLYVALLDWGLSREQATLLLSALAGSGVPGHELGGVVGLLAEGRRRRIRPEELAARIREALPGVRSLEELEDLVLY